MATKKSLGNLIKWGTEVPHLSAYLASSISLIIVFIENQQFIYLSIFSHPINELDLRGILGNLIYNQLDVNRDKNTWSHQLFYSGGQSCKMNVETHAVPRKTGSEPNSLEDPLLVFGDLSSTCTWRENFEVTVLLFRLTFPCQGH